MSQVYDVIVVGYGPGGEVLASTLGAAGLNVLVVERWPTPYPLPRLTTLCGECCRIIQATGENLEQAFGHTLVQPACNFVDTQGDLVLKVPFPGEIAGWPSRVSMFQPDIEKAIADKVERMTNVTVLRGWEAMELWQQGEHVHLIIGPTGGDVSRGKPHTVKARYLVGADGARSFVRQSLGIGMSDSGLHERWLNFDAENLKPLPEKFMNLDIYMDPERPHMYMPIGKRGLRMEFRVMEHENDEDVTRPGVVEDFMRDKYGLDPADFKIMRRVVYHYRNRMAETWRKGRVLLLGDAAHLMPPYVGQGAASAIRDGRNLGWKLIEVLSGRSHDALLDDYQREREPHFRILQSVASKLSGAVNMTNPVAATARNMGMRAQGEADPSLPTLQAGVLFRDVNGGIQAPAGVFAPQGRLRRTGNEALGDDIIGTGFQFWSRQDPMHLLGQDELAYLESLGCSFAVFDDATSEYAVQDVQGVYLAFLNEHAIDAVIVRPDFHVFGGVRQEQANTLVHSLMQGLHSTAMAAVSQEA